MTLCEVMLIESAISKVDSCNYTLHRLLHSIHYRHSMNIIMPMPEYILYIL